MNKLEPSRVGYRQQFESRVQVASAFSSACSAAAAATPRMTFSATVNRTSSPAVPTRPQQAKGAKQVSFASQDDTFGSMKSHMTAFKPTKASVSSFKTTLTLAQTFQRHASRMCDGTKLNAVNQQLHAIGKLPAAIAANLSAMYLSQNNLASLDKIQQFVNLKHLSIGGNLLDHFRELEALRPLLALRNLNLIGNPLCQQPNYRLRVVDCLKQLVLLDGKEIAVQEKQIAAEIASQDRKCRALLVQNHFEIQLLEKITRIVGFRKDFYALVISAMTCEGGRFDQVPTLEQVDLNVDLLLRVWRTPHQQQQQQQQPQWVQMELGLVQIVIRTHAKLQDDTKAKAKEFLLNLAAAQSQHSQPSNKKHRQSTAKNINSIVSMKRAEWDVWEEAYSRVLCLQQGTITQLLQELDRARCETLDFVRNLFVMDPQARQQHVNGICRRQANRRRVVRSTQSPSPSRWSDARVRATASTLVTRGGDASAMKRALADQTDDELLSKWLQYPFESVCASKDRLPPQQVDPDCQDEPRPPSQETKPETSSTAPISSRPVKFPQKICGTSVASSDPPTELVQSSKMPRSTSKRSIRKPEPASCSLDQSKCVRRDSSESFALDTPTRNHQAKVQVSNKNETLLRRDSSASPHAESITSRQSIRKDPSQVMQQSVNHRDGTCDQMDSVIEMMNNTTTTGTVNTTTESSQDRDRRLELERREAQYIKALMESEQRELDLRNQLASVAKKNLVLQKNLQQQDDERKAIRQKSNQLALEMAKPIVLKRCIARWRHFCSLSMRRDRFRLSMVHKTKQQLFKKWRIYVWRSELVQRFQHKRLLRIQWHCLIEWANWSRFQIVQRARSFQKTGQFLHQVLCAWRERTQRTLWIQTRIKQQWVPLQNQFLKRVYFQKWKQSQRLNTQQCQLMRIFWQNHQVPMLKRIVFMHWKLFVVQFARPFRLKAAKAIANHDRKRLQSHFARWSHVVHAAHNLQQEDKRKWFTRWRTKFNIRHRRQNAQRLARNLRFRHIFENWKRFTRQRTTVKWAKQLAQRHAIRKTRIKHWRAWKWFAFCRKQYYQTSSKALKHLFRNILRKTWRGWHDQAKYHRLGKTRATRYYLSKCFAAWKRLLVLRTETKRSRQRSQHCLRRLTKLRLRTMVRDWFWLVQQRKRLGQVANAVNSKRSLRSLTFFWNLWRRTQLHNFHRRLIQALQELNHAKDEFKRLELAFRSAQEESLCFAERNCEANAKMENQDAKLDDMQRLLAKQTQQVRILQQMTDQQRQEAKHKHEEMVKMTSEWTTKQSQLQHEHELIKRENQKLVDAKEQLQQRLEALHANNEELLAQLDKKTQQWKQSQQCVDLWESKCTHLEEQNAQQESQRKEITSKLLSYEQKIQATCQEVLQRENQFTADKQMLHQQIQDQQRQLQSCQVQLDEMSRLVQNKNEQIIKLEQSVTQVQTSRQEWEDRAKSLVQQLEHQQGATVRMNRLEREQLEQEKRLLKTQNKTSEVAIEELLKEIHQSIVHKQDKLEVEQASTPNRQHRVNPVPTSVNYNNNNNDNNNETLVAKALKRSACQSTEPNKENEDNNENDPLHQNRKQVAWATTSSSSFSTSNSSQRSYGGALHNNGQVSIDTGIDVRTQKIHEDLKLLQAKLSKTLEQKPLHEQEFVSSAISSSTVTRFNGSSPSDDEDFNSVVPSLASSSSTPSSPSNCCVGASNAKQPLKEPTKSDTVVQQPKLTKSKPSKRVKKVKKSLKTSTKADAAQAKAKKKRTPRPISATL